MGAAELERRAVVDDGVEVTKELAAAVAENDPADETSAPGAVLAAAAACGLTPERRLVCILILHKALHPCVLLKVTGHRIKHESVGALANSHGLWPVLGNVIHNFLLRRSRYWR